MILRRTDDGAAKCALRDLRREEETSTSPGMSVQGQPTGTTSNPPSMHPATDPTKIDRSFALEQTSSIPGSITAATNRG